MFTFFSVYSFFRLLLSFGLTAFVLLLQTTCREFHRNEMAVYRRFSDFLGLHEKLVEKHQHMGRIVPPAPEKSVVGKLIICPRLTSQNLHLSVFTEKLDINEIPLNRAFSKIPVLLSGFSGFQLKFSGFRND